MPVRALKNENLPASVAVAGVSVTRRTDIDVTGTPAAPKPKGKALSFQIAIRHLAHLGSQTPGEGQEMDRS